jgi:hypothetical protein
LSPRVESKLVGLLDRRDRPAVVEVLRELRAFCRQYRAIAAQVSPTGEAPREALR